MEDCQVVKCDSLSDTEINALSYQTAVSFLMHDGGWFPALGLSLKQVKEYMKALILTSLDHGSLYVAKDSEGNSMGVIQFTDSEHDVTLKQAMVLLVRIARAFGFQTCIKYIQTLGKQEESLESRLKKQHKPYVSIGMIAVFREYQGKGVMRKLMEQAFAYADGLGYCTIVETDTEDNSARYEHLGMRFIQTRKRTEDVTYYDLMR